MNNSPITLLFDQGWANAHSPVDIRFGAFIPPTKGVEIGMYSGFSWQDSSDVGLINTFKRKDESVKQQIVLQESNTIIKQKISVQFSHDSDACSHITIKSVISSELSLYSAYSQHAWRNYLHDEIKSSYTAVNFNHSPLVSNLTHVNWKNTLNKAEIKPQLLWPKTIDLQVQRTTIWHGITQVDCNHIVIRYGVSPLSWVCHWQNHPKKGLVMLEFNGNKPNKVPPLDMVLTPHNKVCYLAGGGFLRAFDDLPVLDLKVPIVPQLRSSYIMQPTITCMRMSDNLEILITSFSYQTSREQFAASCSIKFCSRLDFERAQNELLKITVNGYDFFTYVEKKTKSEQFNNKSYSAVGRSRFAELSEPLARATSYTNEVPKTFVGLMSDIVEFTPWTISSNIIDYPVPPLAFSYKDKTPAQALALCAKAIGAMLVVNDATREITVTPKWPVMPWSTDNATCDVIINDSVIITHNTTDIIKSENNAVMVRGEQQGVSAKVKRMGTAGDLFASDVIDKLITDNQAARQRGSFELANSGNKEQSTIRTKIMQDLPPIIPGMLIGIQYQNELYKATCDSATYSANVDANGKVTVNQSVTLLKAA